MERIRQATLGDRPAIEALVEVAYAVYVPRMGKRPGPMDDDYARRIADGQAWVVRDEEAGAPGGNGANGSVLALLVLGGFGILLLMADGMAPETGEVRIEVTDALDD